MKEPSTSPEWNKTRITESLGIQYPINVDAYPKWQAWLQKTQPKLLVVWGKHDLSFDPGEPDAIAKTYQTPESTYSTRAISRSIPGRMRSQRRYWSS
jgi:hypothetical protein